MNRADADLANAVGGLGVDSADNEVRPLVHGVKPETSWERWA